MRELADIG